MASTPILVIDDESSMLEAVSEFLEDEDYEVHLSRNGEEALRVFERVKPELVLTDLRIPGMPGIEVIRRIKSSNRNTAVVVMTAYGSLEVALDAIRLDVFDFLQKPIDLDCLKEVLKQACEKLRTLDETQKELDFLRSQLILAHQHLDRYRETISEVKSLAFAARLLAEIVLNGGCCMNCTIDPDHDPGMIQSELLKPTGTEAETVHVDQVVQIILESVKRLQTPEVEWPQLPSGLGRE